MRAVIQRVSRAGVRVANGEIGAIGQGLLVLLGVAQGDTAEDAEYLAQRIVGLRVFEDETGKMSRSLADVSGSILAVSQFTLLADCHKGRRPSFTDAASPDLAQPLFDRFVAAVHSQGIPIQTGRFGAHMEVELLNDGPVTLGLDSKRVLE